VNVPFDWNHRQYKSTQIVSAKATEDSRKRRTGTIACGIVISPTDEIYMIETSREVLDNVVLFIERRNLMKTNFIPLEVKLVDNKLVLIRNIQIVEQKEIGTFTDRYELGNKVRDMGFKNVKFSEEALRFIDIDIARIKEEKAQAKAIAKAEKDAAYQRAKFAKAEERALRKAAKDAAWNQAKLERAEARAKLKAEKLVSRQLNHEAKLAEKARVKAEKLALKANSVKNKAKVATVKTVEETVEELEAA
jgi:hypothetical protein